MKFPVLQRYPDFVIDPPPGPPSQNLYPIAQYLKVTAGHPGSRANQPRGIFEGGGIHPVWGTGGKSQLLGVRMMRDPHPHTMAKSPEKRLNHAASKITGLEKPLQIPGDPSCTVISGGIPGLFRIRQETLSGKNRGHSLPCMYPRIPWRVTPRAARGQVSGTRVILREKALFGGTRLVFFGPPGTRAAQEVR